MQLLCRNIVFGERERERKKIGEEENDKLKMINTTIEDDVNIILFYFCAEKIK